jgi:hypothetical protein
MFNELSKRVAYYFNSHEKPYDPLQSYMYRYDSNHFGWDNADDRRLVSISELVEIELVKHNDTITYAFQNALDKHIFLIVTVFPGSTASQAMAQISNQWLYLYKTLQSIASQLEQTPSVGLYALSESFGDNFADQLRRVFTELHIVEYEPRLIFSHKNFGDIFNDRLPYIVCSKESNTFCVVDNISDTSKTFNGASSAYEWYLILMGYYHQIFSKLF